MERLITSYRDVWCDYHGHLESDYECTLMRDAGYFGEHAIQEAKDSLWNVTVTITKDDE